MVIRTDDNIPVRLKHHSSPTVGRRGLCMEAGRGLAHAGGEATEKGQKSERGRKKPGSEDPGVSLYTPPIAPAM